MSEDPCEESEQQSNVKHTIKDGNETKGKNAKCKRTRLFDGFIELLGWMDPFCAWITEQIRILCSER